MLSPQILSYIENHKEETKELLCTLARIPAPSNHEEKRAAFCKSWLEDNGAKGVYIDEALNVIYPIGDVNQEPLYVYMAHSDVVFPDTEELPLYVEDGKICCPGVGDDTANVVAMLMCAKYIARCGLTPREGGVLIVINSGEEGLGNLKGSRKIVSDFGPRIREFVSFDGGGIRSVDRGVGSRRFQVDVFTEGGHSYGNFGTRNAIAVISELICALYQVQIPSLGKTTYNVGMISGGTSVNTIAQQAGMLYEFRSDELASLQYMQEQFDSILTQFREKGLDIRVELVGDRPCSAQIDGDKMETLRRKAVEAIMAGFEEETVFGAGSTDCNIPLSQGIPSVCIALCRGVGAHTRQEYVLENSLLPGVKTAFSMIMPCF